MRHNYTTWDHNRRHLKGLNSDVCGKHCWLFALHMYRGFIHKQLIALFDVCNADRQVVGSSRPNSGPKCLLEARVNAVAAAYKSILSILIILNLTRLRVVMRP